MTCVPQPYVVRKLVQRPNQEVPVSKHHIEKLIVVSTQHHSYKLLSSKKRARVQKFILVYPMVLVCAVFVYFCVGNQRQATTTVPPVLAEPRNSATSLKQCQLTGTPSGRWLGFTSPPKPELIFAFKVVTRHPPVHNFFFFFLCRYISISTGFFLIQF